jgi:hypothetical protein
LIDGLAGEQDRLWPWRAWPPMRFDRPLGVGAQCRLVQRGRQVPAGEFVIIVIPLVLHGE